MDRLFKIIYIVITGCVLLSLSACNKNKKKVPIDVKEGGVCAVLAHPDDETIISGTLAMLCEKGYDVTVVYVTSGDEGADETGQGLHGNSLAKVREKEAQEALHTLNVKNPPVFLRFPDGYVFENIDSVQQSLTTLLDRIKPQVIISFGPDGITGNPDHIGTGSATDKVFDRTAYGELLLHMAVTRPLPPYYANGVAVRRKDLDLYVKVSACSAQRIRAVESHKTQYNRRTRSAYRLMVKTMRNEKFIIARSRTTSQRSPHWSVRSGT